MSVISSVLRPAAQPSGATPQRLSGDPSDSYWRSLFLFNGYRFIVAVGRVCVSSIASEPKSKLTL